MNVLMEILDKSHIESLGGLECPELVEIIEDFLSDLETNLSELCRLANEGNHNELRESAHRLKGGASMSGFPALAQVAANLERLAQSKPAQISEQEITGHFRPAILEARMAFKEEVNSPT